MPPSSVHFNGSVNLPDAETVMREISARIPAGVRRMTDGEREELRRRLDEFDEQEWQKELDHATQQFHESSMTDDVIDEAVRKLRYESRS